MFFRMSTNIFIRTDLPATIQSSLTQNPLIQIRHLAAGLSRQMSKIELQMADNAPFAMGKNLYTGGENSTAIPATDTNAFRSTPHAPTHHL